MDPNALSGVEMAILGRSNLCGVQAVEESVPLVIVASSGAASELVGIVQDIRRGSPHYRIVAIVGFGDLLAQGVTAAVMVIGARGEYVWGYIDKVGGMVIQPNFREAKPFTGPLARVITLDGIDQLIDKTGRVIWSAKQ